MIEGSLSAVRPAGAHPVTKRLGELALAAAGAFLVAISAQVRIPAPTPWGTLSPVPITAQTLAVLLVGMLLGSRIGLLSLGLYLVGGSTGLPFFAAGALLGPTGGYLVGFAGAAYVVGRLFESGWARDPHRAFLALLAGNGVVYLVGLPWLAHSVGWSAALPLGLYPFVIGDLLKLVCAVAVACTRYQLK